MALSEQQRATLELGKLLVKELGLENGVDTLSRWMAHYLAEKITLAKTLPKGSEKDEVEKECFSLILEIWKNRWELRHERQPLKDFRQLYEVLRKLDPYKSEPYYFNFHENQITEVKDGSFDPEELKKFTAMAVQIDKVARIWIDFVLRQAAAKANNETIEKIVENAIQLPDNADTSIIRIITSEDEIYIDNDKPFDIENNKQMSRKEELCRRISELKKFEKVNKYLKNCYEEELAKLNQKA